LCERLQGLQRATWEAAVTELRCSGSAAARRCAAALLGESVAGDWRLAQWLAAPEPFVVAVALAEALRSDAQRRGGQQQADVGLRERVRAIPARPEVMLSCLRRFGPGQFRAIAALGPDGLNLIAAGLEMPELRAYMFANLSSLGAAARPLLPLVLRELHRDPDGHAARALYAMGISADDPDRAHIVTEVVAAWHESPSGQSALLPAMAAVADEPVIRATLLASRAQLQHWMTLAASTKAQWRSLIDLVADEDDSTKLRVALAVMAPTLPQPLPFNYEEWTRVAAAPVLQAIVSRRLEDSSGDAVSLAQSLLEATALGIELARLGAVLERLGPAVEKALPVVVERQGWTRSLAVALARHRPALFLQVLPESVPPGIASVFAELPLRPELIAPLADRCASKNDDVRTAAAIALVRQGPAAGQRVLSLLFGKPEAAEPMRAALFALASRAEFLLPELQQFLRDNPGRAEQVFRCAASLGPHGLVWALDAVGSDDESTRQLLREGLRASDRGTRVLALQILEDRDTPDLQGLVRTACGDPDAEVRRRACLMMLRMSNPDLAAVEPLLLDHDPLLRRRGFEALAKTREWPTRVLALATDALGDPDARVRIAVVAAFAANTALAAKVGKALAEALEVTSEPELASALRRLISK
jgi:hypothetical protein